MPTMPSTTPMSTFDSSRIAPCSMCSSTNAADAARRAARFRDAIRDSADCPDAFADGETAVADDVERLRSDTAGHRLASDDSAFLVGKDDEFERMARRDSVLAK
jgi:hypothetical protein